ncbi:hypothetical protein QCD58_005061 [Enterobacter hormaechei]|nr:hypothetical protein [Enterobacter hormaechei]
MNIRYPFRKADGTDFSGEENITPLMRREPSGSWLLGGNGMWHGGIHISDANAPASTLKTRPVKHGEPVPLQFMADGAVVAYRLNHDYPSTQYCGKTLRFSSTFVLVRSQCRPDPENVSTWLDFYSLYMHLAPVEEYPVSPCYRVNAGHSGIVLHQYVRGQDGLPDNVADSGDTAAYAVPGRTHERLGDGERVVLSRTGRFYLHRAGKTSLETFGLVRRLHDGKPGKTLYWVTLDPELMEPDGEMESLMPDWMHQAKAQGQFDRVVLTDGADCWQVRAGEPLGFLGLTESPGEGPVIVDPEWCVHIEVLSTDPNMPGFLSNPGHVTRGERYIIAEKGKALSIRCGGAGNYTFQNGIAKLGQRVTVRRSEADPTQDTAGTWWFNIMGGGWLPQEDISEAGQYDLLKRGFQPLEEYSGGDMVNGPFESWVPGAFGHLERAAQQGHSNQYSLVPAYYRNLLDRMSSQHSGNVTAEDIRIALTVRDPLVMDMTARLVVKHHSEWYGGRSSGRWEGFYKRLGMLEKVYTETWLREQEWMSQVPAFSGDEAVWHMHPLVFLDAIKCRGYDFSTRAGTIRAIIEESRKQGFSLNSQIAYILATVKRETGDTFQPVREGDWGGHTSTDEYRKKHYRYYPYYGRGYVQITWDYNYKAYSEKLGVDLVSEPDRALEPNNSLFILIDGFKNGVFTGKKLTDYVSKDRVDFLNARRCINGLDHAEQIKGFAEDFLSKLDAGELI